MVDVPSGATRRSPRRSRIVTVVRVLSRWPSGTSTDARVAEDGRGIEIGGHLRSPGEAEVGASVPNQVHDGIGGRGRARARRRRGEVRELTDEVGECDCEPEDRHNGHLSGHDPLRPRRRFAELPPPRRARDGASTKTSRRRWSSSLVAGGGTGRCRARPRGPGACEEHRQAHWCNAAAAARVTLPCSATATTTANPRRSTDQGR